MIQMYGKKKVLDFVIIQKGFWAHLNMHRHVGTNDKIAQNVPEKIVHISAVIPI